MILYLHIPFCTSKCGYCAFNSSSDFFHLQDSYLLALLQDLKRELEGKKHLLTSIYIGGGTPNTLSSNAYEKIFELITQFATLTQDCEITLECNPSLITSSWCEDLRSLGANRLSVGVQSFFDDKLDFLQRDHQGRDIAKVLQKACSAGFENLSIDLIYGTPLDNQVRLKQEIALASSLPLTHLSAYSLSIDKGSKFYCSPPTLPLEDMGEIVRLELESRGFRQYEVSNFCKPYKSLHNLSYWKGEEYIGCGAGAVGYQEGVRYTKLKHIPSYIKNPHQRSIEVLKEEERLLERLFLGLRCEVGVPLSLLDANKVKTLIEEDKAYIQEERLKARDFFLADEIALYLS
ncbi:radical SAM family heme chaperone HemW [Helicobacter brantae]|uniref:Heme chaperone HemW n=1 Tax=Helicobacter brantae TaxID=375927 RepID=A0A3D8IYW0_9HELI|nr:radical SAM family heme chaperone HemW [Helicobacter brantae]RDU70233.1 coproporphyrinogen III oxidase family protein [Helicobacter brantae]